MYKILIIDDEDINLIFLSRLLETEGYYAVTAKGFDSAMKIIENDRPDVIFLDIMMPVTDGIEVIKILQSNEETKDIPIIVVSARGDSDDVQECLDLGAYDYIRKPIYNTELLARLKAALRLSTKIKELKRVNEELAKANCKLEVLSERDGLTGIMNRRFFDKRVEELWKSCYREKRCLSMIMLDVDFFKLYNDTYGHLQGDECLKIVANIIQKNLKRPLDFVARFGGEEFAIVLPETDKKGAVFVAENIRCDIENSGMPHNSSKVSNFVTVSCGVTSCIPEKIDGLKDFIHVADKALYRAKSEGRNRVFFSEE